MGVFMEQDKNVPVDYFGKDLCGLKEKKLFLLDMDGTIYNEDKLFDKVIELTDHIRSIGGRYVFITNNSSKSVLDYIKKINRLGIEADADNFFTSTQAMAHYIKKNHHGKKVYCQGTKSMVTELKSLDINITEDADESADIVLVGFDTELTSEKIRKTCSVLMTRDVVFLATNPDLRCPASFGFIPDCGSICQMIENATEKSPIFIGKPEAIMVKLVMEKYGFSKEETVVVGDRLYTDIATGINAGVDTACVLTGEAKADDIKNGNIKPTYTIECVKELWGVLAES